MIFKSLYQTKLDVATLATIRDLAK